MDNKVSKTKSSNSIFRVGDLVKFVSYSKGDSPQIWKRSEDIGVILSISNSDSPSYSILCKGESFESIEVYHIDTSNTV